MRRHDRLPVGPGRRPAVGSSRSRGRRYTPMVARPAPLPDPSPREAAVVAVIATQIGPLHAAATAAGIVGLELRTTGEAFAASVGARTRRPLLPVSDVDASPAARAHLASLERQVAEHFAGTRDAFDVPVVLEGIGEWDRRVLEGVPDDRPRRDGILRRDRPRIGAPGAAARAVGGGVGRNPIASSSPANQRHRPATARSAATAAAGIGSREELLGLKERLLVLEGMTPRAAIGRPPLPLRLAPWPSCRIPSPAAPDAALTSRALPARTGGAGWGARPLRREGSPDAGPLSSRRHGERPGRRPAVRRAGPAAWGRRR